MDHQITFLRSQDEQLLAQMVKSSISNSVDALKANDCFPTHFLSSPVQIKHFEQGVPNVTVKVAVVVCEGRQCWSAVDLTLIDSVENFSKSPTSTK